MMIAMINDAHFDAHETACVDPTSAHWAIQSACSLSNDAMALQAGSSTTALRDCLPIWCDDRRLPSDDHRKVQTQHHWLNASYFGS